MTPSRLASGWIGAARPWPATVALLALAAALLLPARAGTLDASRVQESVTPSGFRVIVKEEHGVNLVAINVWLRVGGYLEDERTTGFAHALEHMVFKGGGDVDPGELDFRVESLGGLLSAATNKDWTQFGVTVASEHAGPVIDLMGETLRKAELREPDWEIERRVLLEEIERFQTSPIARANALLYELAYQDHPYKRDVRGDPLQLSTLNLDELRAFYRQHYRPENMAVIVVGDVDTNTVSERVKRAFEPNPAARPAPARIPAEEQPCRTVTERTVPSPFRSSFYCLGYPAPSVHDTPDVYAFDLILTWLDLDGIGRLSEALQGKAAALDATFETRRQKGLLAITIETEATPLAEIEQIVKNEIARLRDRPLTPQELAFTLARLEGGYVLDNEPFSGQAATLGYYSAIDSWRFGCDYLERCKGVTAAQLQEVARKYLDPNHFVSVKMQAQPQGELP